MRGRSAGSVVPPRGTRRAPPALGRQGPARSARGTCKNFVRASACLLSAGHSGTPERQLGVPFKSYLNLGIAASWSHAGRIDDIVLYAIFRNPESARKW